MSDNQKAMFTDLLVDINKEINVLTDIRTLLTLIIDKAPRVVAADRASVFLYDDKPDQLWTLAASGLGENEEIRVPSTHGIVGHVFTTAKILNIPDAYADQRFNPDVDKQTNYHTRNILCAPIFNKGRKPIGVVQLINKIDGTFDASDESIIEVFCDLAAVAIENVLLYDELKASYDAIQRAQEQLIHSEKLAIVGRMAARIAHEIKNQMVGLTFAELLQAEYPDDETIQEYAETIIDTKQNMLSIVNEVRDFAQNRTLAYEKKSVAIKTLVERVISFCNLDPDIKNHELTVAYKEEPVVHVDPTKIHQLLINLVRNAGQAIGDEKRGHIHIQVATEQKDLVLSVTDNGSGIPEESLTKIWEPFYTTKDDSGTGLGLDICLRIAQGHGGTLVCDSKVGSGTTFTLKVPLEE